MSKREQPDRRAKKSKVIIPLEEVGEDMVVKILGQHPTMASWMALARTNSEYYGLLTSKDTVRRIPMIVRVPVRTKKEVERLKIPEYWKYAETMDITFIPPKKIKEDDDADLFCFGKHDIYGERHMVPLFSNFPNLVHLTVRTDGHSRGPTAVSESMFVVDQKYVEWAKNLKTVTIFGSDSAVIEISGGNLNYMCINHTLDDNGHGFGNSVRFYFRKYACPSVMINVSPTGTSATNQLYFCFMQSQHQVNRLVIRSTKKVSPRSFVRLQTENDFEDIASISMINIVLRDCTLRRINKLNLNGSYFYHLNTNVNNGNFVRLDVVQMLNVGTIDLFDLDVLTDIKITLDILYYTFDNWVNILDQCNALGLLFNVKCVMAFEGILSERTIRILRSKNVDVIIKPRSTTTTTTTKTDGELVDDVNTIYYKKMIDQTDDTFEMMKTVGM